MMHIITSIHLTRRTEERWFPISRHRSKRIHKKLVKKYGGEYKEVPVSYMMNEDTLYLHPSLKNSLDYLLRRQEEALFTPASFVPETEVVAPLKSVTMEDLERWQELLKSAPKPSKRYDLFSIRDIKF